MFVSGDADKPPAIVVGNGPSLSSKGISFAQSIFATRGHIDFAYVNWFMQSSFLPRDFTWLFGTVRDPKMYQFWAEALTGGYTCKKILTPVEHVFLGPLAALGIPIENFWKDVLAPSPLTSRIFLRGSNEILPTTGFQALHYVLAQGHRDVALVGIDLYSGNQRYANQTFAQRVNRKHARIRGYEKSHSRFHDLLYLARLIHEYQPRLHIVGRAEFWEETRDILQTMVSVESVQIWEGSS